MLDRSAVGQLAPLSSIQNDSDCRQAIRYVSPTAYLSNIGRPTDPTGELLNTRPRYFPEIILPSRSGVGLLVSEFSKIPTPRSRLKR